MQYHMGMFRVNCQQQTLDEYELFLRSQIAHPPLQLVNHVFHRNIQHLEDVMHRKYSEQLLKSNFHLKLRPHS